MTRFKTGGAIGNPFLAHLPQNHDPHKWMLPLNKGEGVKVFHVMQDGFTILVGEWINGLAFLYPDNSAQAMLHGKLIAKWVVRLKERNPFIVSNTDSDNSLDAIFNWRVRFKTWPTNRPETDAI